MPRALKLTAAGEEAVLALVRAARNSGGYLGRLGDAAFSVLRPPAPPPVLPAPPRRGPTTAKGPLVDSKTAAELRQVAREEAEVEARRRELLARRRALLASAPPGWEPAALRLWVVDADGLPPRPWRVRLDDVVECATLGCDVPAHICVTRQKASESQRTKDTWRGEASEYPCCVTERCAQGRGIREALEPQEVGAGWRREGPGKRWVSRRRADRGVQEAARKRLKRSGLLEPERLLDVDRDPVTPEGED